LSSALARLLLIALVVLATAGCAGGGDDGDSRAANAEGGAVAVLLPEGAGRWEAVDRRVFEQAFSEANVDYLISNAEGDAAQQQAQAEQALANGAKVLVLAHVDQATGASIVERAHQSDAVVIDLDRLTTGGGGADYYVSTDHEQSGRLLGEGLVSCVDAAGVDTPAVAVVGAPASPALEQGYEQELKGRFDSGDWTQVGDGPIEQGAVAGVAARLDGALATSDEAAQAVVDARRARGLEPVALAGLGTDVRTVQRVLAGEQCMAAYEPVRDESAAAADLAISLVQGKEPSVDGSVDVDDGDVPALLLEPVEVTKETVRESVVDKGLLTWDEICVDEYERACPPPAER
jgi:D-xylose transport system substrate-binding protein